MNGQRHWAVASFSFSMGKSKTLSTPKAYVRGENRAGNDIKLEVTSMFQTCPGPSLGASENMGLLPH